MTAPLEHVPSELLPLFLLNTVLFPQGRLPLRVFEARYMDMARDCLKRGRPFGVCRISEGLEVGAPAKHDVIGTLAGIADCDMQQLGVLQLTAVGGRRFRVLDTSVNGQGLVSARIELLDEGDAPLPEEAAACAVLLKRIVAEHGEAVFAAPHRYDSAAWVGYRLAELLPLPLPDKQKLLAMDDCLERLSMVQRLLQQGAG